MKHEARKYLDDIRKSIEAIEMYTSDLSSVEDYARDAETIDAVERRLAIIGEAVFKINKLNPNLPITEKLRIIKLSHILVHDYDLITHSTIWLIIKNNLPVLKKQVQDLLA
ncbi:MAG: DUF86 domain-containing protein [Flavisolibacter sp.]|nr:DUF86 domain-containing protein [Flavisolibacter sp.]